ncbi:hypothetical protein GCM10010123_24670 [Pilimelia anulata]|uniref:Uncharacterized protein n=1 Tax=Pilimelia anulata TaxID=53371 RepID=A0A8J3FAV3_9ACTN|nr:hypothetical protein [Pilimelia anulata]GGJ93874.1 hypothetical protein GCM10010123_24670 [Pilimelia anulata]
MNFIRVRIIGTPADCATTVTRLRDVLAVVDISRFLPCRDRPGQVRVYLVAAETEREGHR